MADDGWESNLPIGDPDMYRYRVAPRSREDHRTAHDGSMIDIHAIMERCGCLARGCQVRITHGEPVQYVYHDAREKDSESCGVMVPIPAEYMDTAYIDDVADRYVADAINDCHRTFDAGPPSVSPR